MKIQLKNIGFFLLILLVSLISFSSCHNDLYDEHYSISKEMISDKTLWESIKANPDLSKFAWALRKTGYNKALSSPQMFTVWAPVNSEVNIDTTIVKPDTIAMAREFIENHISRFSYSASGNSESRILLLNKKVTKFKSQGPDFYFGNIKLMNKNSLSSNGILHVISNSLPFFSNIWEYLSTGQNLDSIRTYLYSFNKISFDPDKSVPGDVNADGQRVYLDSVKFNNNKMFTLLGQLNNEDSSYVAILPTNTAWNKSYGIIKDYFLYYYSTTDTKFPKITADTLQRKNTLNALVKDLVFSTKMQKSPKDSMISTSRNVFQSPQYLFDGATVNNNSNGTVYITDNLKYKDWESWNQKIIVEGEKAFGRKSDAFSSIYERTYNGIDFPVSGNRYIELSPAITSGNPNVTFDIPNTLSGKLNPDGTLKYGARYNIYCVFLPISDKNGFKPNKVSFTLSYQNESGKTITTTYDNTVNKVKNYYITNKDKVTKLLIASNVTFPNCEFGLELPTVKLKVIGNASALETTTYIRSLYIDCIIFEPVQ